MSTFIAILHARTNATVDREKTLELTVPPPGAQTPLVVELWTQWDEVDGFRSPVPRHLWVKVQGDAESLDQYVELAFNVANVVPPFVAVVANAAVGDPTFNVVYEVTAGKDPKEFAEFVVVEPEHLPLYVRDIPLDDVVAVTTAADQSPDRERIFRAVTHYQLALSYWKPGNENRTLAHLWMGMEALTRVALKAYCRKEGIEEAELPAKLGVEKREVQAAIRKLILFQGDDGTYAAALKARNGWQHSFERFDRVRTSAESSKLRTAEYLRSAILELAGVNHDERARLCSSPYAEPLANWENIVTVRGTLSGPPDALTPDSWPPPSAGPRLRIGDYVAEGQGVYRFKVECDFQPRLPERLKLEQPVVRLSFPSPDSGPQGL